MKKILFLILLAIISFFTYTNFFHKKDSIEFITQKAIRGDISKKIEAVGEVFATELIDVGAQVSGQIEKIYVKLGDKVKQGDLIAKIDDKTQKNIVETKKAQLSIHQAKLNSAKVAYDIAKTRYERENELFKNKATSKSEFENAKNNYAIAKANIQELESLINQAKILLNTSEIDLNYTKILAPKDGIVVSIPVEEGQTINANQTTPTIVHIADLSRLKIKMQIAEGDITKIKVGTKVEYSILSEPERKFKTKIDIIDPALTTLSDGSYKVTNLKSSANSLAVYYYAQSIVDNHEGLLRIGMTTQNSLYIAEKNDTLIIPSIAVKKEGKKAFVSVLKDDKSIEKKEVKIGISDGLNSEILSGLSQNDNVIISQSDSKEIELMIRQELR